MPGSIWIVIPVSFFLLTFHLTFTQDNFDALANVNLVTMESETTFKI